MSPITHLLVGWVCLERLQVSRRDKALVVLAGLAPDLDGLGIVVDFATRSLGMPETDFYQSFHRMYGHGLPAGIVIAVLAGVLGGQRLWVASWAFVNVHLHFLCDVLGSRGTTAEDIWGIPYLAPFNTAFEFSWSGQWPLVGWQNTAITVVLLGAAMTRAMATGYSPVELASEPADVVFVATLRRWRHGLLATAAKNRDKT